MEDALNAGKAYATINNNVPFFTEEEKGRAQAFKDYAELDALGRCGTAFAGLCKDTIPTEDRGDIGAVRPSGWHTVRYDFVDGGFLYNRCHLVGYQLAGDNDDPRNLITGTRYLNVTGMLRFENIVSNYLYASDNHVLYRVTPIYEHTTDLVALGVQMESYSVEDSGAGVCFNVFCPNIQPGVKIDYATGDSELDPEWVVEPEPVEATPIPEGAMEYVLNVRSGKFHLPDCPSVKDIAEYNRHSLITTREDLIADGYTPCGGCKP